MGRTTRTATNPPNAILSLFALSLSNGSKDRTPRTKRPYLNRSFSAGRNSRPIG